MGNSIILISTAVDYTQCQIESTSIMQNVNISQAVLYAHCMFELGMFVFDAHTSSLTRRIIYDSFIGQN